jgi:hypothetical protein
MLHHSRFLLLGLVVAFGLHQATALAELTPFEQSSQEADIQLCSCEADCCASSCCTPLLGRCCNPCASCCDAACDDCCGDGCCGDGCCCTPWTLLLRFGTTYYSSPFLSQWGISEGVTVGYRCNPCWGIYGSVDFNHTDFSSQVFGTVGVQKFGVAYAGSLMDRTSVWILFDQFADLEIGPDSYLHQVRFYTGLVTAPQREIGVAFSVPTSDGPAAPALTPMGSSSVMPVGDSFVGPYLRATAANGVRLDAAVGYSDAGTGGVAAGVGTGVPLTANTDLFFNGKLSEGDNYAFALGLELKGGRRDTRH